ncbi:DinB family protein [Echinicola shivajiensis]|uniref:DinB family protein n=1 Tax=Echinicola shivajiensis TaxID=1035916 RepID=UPI001BFC1181|nr:DinB family protein [Echinicola shivajiensis]
MTHDNLRKQLVALLQWEDAHINFDTAIQDIPETFRGVQPPGLSHSLWQILEHLRIAQHDILDFCQNPNYKELAWPEDYWPASRAPASAELWEKSIHQYRSDRQELIQLALNPELDLADNIPHGTGQSYLRELLLVADHNAYHIGQIILVRRLLDIWP